MVVLRHRLNVVLVTKNHAGREFLDNFEHDVLSLIEVTTHEHALGFEAEAKNGHQKVVGLSLFLSFIWSEVNVTHHDMFVSTSFLHTSWDANIVFTHGSRCPN